MKNIQVVFSPTGGTQKVINAITKNLENIETIDLTDTLDDFTKYQFDADDTVFIAMPSFGGRAPEVAIERLSQLKGNSANCILIATYGNRDYEDTLVEMEDTAKKSGFNIVAAISAISEHSIMPQYATGRPDEKDRQVLDEYASKIIDKLEDKDFSNPEIPGNRPYKKASQVPLVPKANKSCDECRICVRSCPVQAISSDNPRKSDKKRCIACMRCVRVCPQNARKVNELMVSTAALAIKKACSKPKENELFI